ncbi:hypothetical protein D3C81_2284050 [compost metagenome]
MPDGIRFKETVGINKYDQIMTCYLYTFNQGFTFPGILRLYNKLKSIPGVIALRFFMNGLDHFLNPFN